MNSTLTNFTPEHTKTYESDKTTTISNTDFLWEIFANNTYDEHPMLVSFRGNPANVVKTKWYGHPWTGTSAATLPEDANNYFSLARFKPNESGEYRRKKSQFQGLHAVMLDDIGRKFQLNA